jgi:cytochrome c556
MPGKTRAKPEIWTMSDKFAAAAAKLESAAGKLEMAAATGEKDKIAAAMKGFGKATCGVCHSDFRGPKPKKTM